MQIWRSLTNQRGSSLLFVIVLITILSIFFGILMLMFTMQNRFAKQYQFEIQARYNAESGIYCAIDTLQQDLSIRWEDEPYILDWGDTTFISIKEFGGFMEVISKGLKKGKQTDLRVLLGEIPSDDFQYSLFVSDDRSHVTFTGDCHITGNIQTGRMGIQIRPFKGRKFTGSIDGVVEIDDEISLPQFQAELYENLITKYDKYINLPPAPYIYFKNLSVSSSAFYNDYSRVYYSEDNIILDDTNRALLSSPAMFISKKNITIKDSVIFPFGSVFIAKEKIILQNKVTGNQGIFYAQNEIIIEDNVNCSGQFIAGQGIIVSDLVSLQYPTVLYLNGFELMGERIGNIELTDFVSINGSVIYPTSESFGVVDKGKIFIDHDAILNGALYCSNQVDFNGTLNGSLVTEQLYFYHAPAHYINWLRSGEINILKREKYFCLPLHFSQTPLLDIIYYEEF